MTVYIDPPRWPAHGTVFSHLISDTSLSELHELARALGVSERAFARDHYDVWREWPPDSPVLTAPGAFGDLRATGAGIRRAGSRRRSAGRSAAAARR